MEYLLNFQSFIVKASSYILDTSEFCKYFEDRGLLFQEKSATVNAERVRVYQYANLDAKHMGFLEEGDAVQVLDRSALKRTIDPWGEYYWYRVKRESDGCYTKLCETAPH